MAKVSDPLKIASMVVKNRIATAPCFTNTASESTYVNPLVLEGYRQIAQGGAGLVITEAACVHPRGRGSFARRLGNMSDLNLAGLEELAYTIKREGASACLQLQHARLIAHEGSDNVVKGGGQEIAFLDLSDDQIEETIAAYAQGALRAKKAGFDAVEVHACHGCLMQQFMSPRANKRKDKWNDLTLFPTRAIKAIKELVGKEFPVLWRISAEEGAPGGFTLEDTLSYRLPAFEQAGIDAIHVSTGSRSSLRATAMEVPPLYDYMGTIMPQARAVKARTKLPVIAVGKVMLPHMVNSIIERGWADMVALGRALIVDPEFPNKMLQGREEEIRLCIGCSYCYTRTCFENVSLRCSINPARGRELTMDKVLRPSEIKRKVVVVGGGPAGMEAARLLSLKGNQVTLMEKDGMLGGTLFHAGSMKRLYTKDLQHLAKYQNAELLRLGVEVRLNADVTSAALKAMGPDVVIIATGSKYAKPEYLSGDGAAVTLDEYLKSSNPIGERVLVLGGRDGAEVSVSLAREGKKVTLIHGEGSDSLGEAVYIHDPLRKDYLKDYLTTEQNLEVLTNAKLVRTENHEAHIDTPEGIKTVGYDSIIVALERHSDRQLEGQLDGVGAEVFWIGDCVRPGSVVGAIDDAWFVTRKLSISTAKASGVGA